jgi:hypothetical protein
VDSPNGRCLTPVKLNTALPEGVFEAELVPWDHEATMTAGTGFFSLFTVAYHSSSGNQPSPSPLTFVALN